jgi:hypothetical protein
MRKFLRFQSLFLSLAALNGLRIIFDSASFRKPELKALLAVCAAWGVLFCAVSYPQLMQLPLAYKLRRAHGKIIDRLMRPFGKPGILERLYLHVRPPKWCRQSQDDLMLIYRDQHKLMNEGQVVLAMLVQANGRLFKKGVEDAPANVVYTPEIGVENSLTRLRDVAVKIASLKGTKPEDADEGKFARMVSYEYGRDFRVTVPDKLSDGLDVTYTTIMVHRKHLPEGYLANVFFPLLVHTESRAAMILPARYWSAELLSDWGVS